MATLKSVELPLQIEAEPEITAAVETLLTVTTAEPLMPVPAQPPVLVTETKV